MPFGSVCPVFCKMTENGTPKTFLSVEMREQQKKILIPIFMRDFHEKYLFLNHAII